MGKFTKTSVTRKQKLSMPFASIQFLKFLLKASQEQKNFSDIFSAFVLRLMKFWAGIHQGILVTV
jgi:hypothetical protein